MTLGERIKKVRKEFSLTQQNFGGRIGIKQNSVALIESGKRNVSNQAILSICREFNVNEEWLRTGEGEMLKAKPMNELDALAQRYNLQHKDYVLIEKLLKMPQNQRDGVFQFMQDVVLGATTFGIDPYRLEFPREHNVHDWTDDEMREELERQLAGEKIERAKGETGKSITYGYGNSSMATG